MNNIFFINGMDDDPQPSKFIRTITNIEKWITEHKVVITILIGLFTLIIAALNYITEIKQ